MATSHDVKNQIDLMRNNLTRHRRDIVKLRSTGISTDDAEALLDRMLIKIEELCQERDRLRMEEPAQAKVVGRRW